MRRSYERAYAVPRLSSWEALLPFQNIENAAIDSTFGMEKLKLTHRPTPGGKSVNASFSHKHFTNTEGAFLPVFERYFGRHKTAVARSAAK